MTAGQNKKQILGDFFAQAPFPCILFDSKLYLLNFNQYATDIFQPGATPEELVGKHITELYTNVKESGRYERYLEVLRTGKPVKISDIINHPTFGEEHFDLYAFKAGAGLGLIIIDTTVRTQVEAALRESEAKYRILFETSADGILIADVETRKFTYCNPAMQRMLGYCEEELAGMAVDQIHPKESLEHVISEFEAQARGEKSLVPNIPCLRKDGSIIYVDINTSTTRINGRQSNIGIFRDTTAHKQAEMLLRTQCDLGVKLSATRDLISALNCILETALSTEEIDCGGVYIVDSKTGALNLLTHSKLSTPFVETVAHFEADSPNTRLVMAKKPFYLSHQELVPIMDEARRREGLKAVAVVPVLYKDQVIAAFNLGSHSCDEISQATRNRIEAIGAFIGSSIARIQAEEELRLAKESLERQNEELKALDKLKDGLIRDVTHELRTPVAKQRMQIEILEIILDKHNLREECQHALDVTEAAIDRQEAVINNILNLSRLESGAKCYKRELVALDDLLLAVIDDSEAELKAQNIIVEVTLARADISSDHEMLIHVFSNLLNNAIKYRNPDENPKIMVSLEKTSKTAIVRISDNGIGLNSEELEHVFERFYQVSPSSPGSGVGLSIAKMITESLGGTIRLESPGKSQGTAAIVELPFSTT